MWFAISWLELLHCILLAVVTILLAYFTASEIASNTKRALDLRALYKQGLYYPRSTLPLLGNTLDVLIFHKHRLQDWVADQSRASSGKPWVLSVLGRPATIVVTSPEACEDIFKTQFEVFGRGPEIQDLNHDLLGTGLVAVDGHAWLTQRRTASHLFSTKMLRDVMGEVLVDKTQTFCKLLETCAESGRQVSMKSLLSKFTSDVFTKMGLGVDLKGLDNSLEGDVDHEHPFIQAVADYGPLFQRRVQRPMWFWKLKRLLNIGDEGRFKKSANVVLDLVHEIMIESLASKTSAAAPNRDLLTLFLESSGTTDVIEVRDTIMNFFLAGTDTTSFVMSWFLVMMNRHPHVLCKLREEIQIVLPDLRTRIPTMEELQKLTYLEAAIKENLRLNFTILHRTATRATTLSDGTYVPPGTYVLISAYAAGRMTTTWGPDADEFRPERFIDESTGKLKVLSPFKFISFLGGPRQCVGMKFAMLEMKTALATLFSRFDLETVEDPFDITYDYSFMLPVKGELMVNVRKVASASE